jgi:hypothetical protein
VSRCGARSTRTASSSRRRAASAAGRATSTSSRRSRSAPSGAPAATRRPGSTARVARSSTASPRTGARAARSRATVRRASSCRSTSPSSPDASPTLDELDRLLHWLVASCEYDDELERLDGWRSFLHGRADGAALLAEIVRFAAGFEGRGDRALGSFTRGVDPFLRDALPRRRWREDAMQCARRRTEYHLNMVGAEILNRAWRAEFLACRRHVVVMPGCMRRRDDAGCAAERDGLDLRCTGCTRGCAVDAATRVAARAGAQAVAVTHGSDFSRFLRSPALAGGDVGIVGVACVPGLLGAGWRARAAGFPAQCVLLEASGCVHWRDEPVPTAIDLGELERALRSEPRVREALPQAPALARAVA